jgi:uncharacterized protein (TIGR03034 family)
VERLIKKAGIDLTGDERAILAKLLIDGNTLSINTSGIDIAVLQKALNQMGFTDIPNATGNYSGKTATAIGTINKIVTGQDHNGNSFDTNGKVRLVHILDELSQGNSELSGNLQSLYEKDFDVEQYDPVTGQKTVPAETPGENQIFGDFRGNPLTRPSGSVIPRGNDREPLVFSTNRHPGYNADGSKAADMTYGDYTKEEIIEIDKLFEMDSLGAQYEVEERGLIANFKNLAPQFSQGELTPVLNKMIEHFIDGSGTDFSDETLTRYAKEHPATVAYTENVKNAVMEELGKNNGNLKSIIWGIDSDLNRKIQSFERPVFTTVNDERSGLKLAMNDTWANEVIVNDYKLEGNNFSGTLKFKIYDHFGLDKSDVSEAKGKLFVWHPGFRAWFALQHYAGFNNKYKPFVSVVEFEIPFSGTLSN